MLKSNVQNVTILSTQHFATQKNFLDPTLTSDGKPYGPWRYKEIVKELFLISKNIGTSYNELLLITPRERDYLQECVIELSEMLKKRVSEQQGE